MIVILYDLIYIMISLFHREIVNKFEFTKM